VCTSICCVGLFILKDVAEHMSCFIYFLAETGLPHLRRLLGVASLVFSYVMLGPLKHVFETPLLNTFHTLHFVWSRLCRDPLE
jgi:hypothetical protein